MKIVVAGVVVGVFLGRDARALGHDRDRLRRIRLDVLEGLEPGLDDLLHVLRPRVDDLAREHEVVGNRAGELGGREERVRTLADQRLRRERCEDADRVELARGECGGGGARL